MVTTNISKVDLINDIGKVFTDNIKDITGKNRPDWISYKLPEQVADVPSITLEMDKIEWNYASANDIVSEGLDADGIYRENFFIFGRVPLNIYVTTSKVAGEQEVILNNTTLTVDNSALNKIVSYEVENLILRDRNLFLKVVEDIMIKETVETFDDGTRFWTSYISCELLFRSTWVKEYLEGSLVNSYTLDVVTTQ